MGQALAQRANAAIAFTTLAERREYCVIVAKTAMVPKDFRGKPDDILVASQMGAELFLDFFQSLQNIAVINGRPTIWGDTLLALVLGREDCITVEETRDESTGIARCVIRRQRKKAVMVVESTFSVEDAKLAGLWGKGGPWTQHPKRMLKMRARGFAIRDAYADALRGVQCTEEVLDSVPVAATPVESRVVNESKGNAGLKARLAPAPVAEVEHDECTGEVAVDVAAEMMAFIESASSAEVLKTADWAQAKTLSEDAQADIRIAYSEKMKELQNG